MRRDLLNKSWKQHPTKQQLYGHISPISKTIQIRRTKHAGHCWRSKDWLISDVLPWTLSHGCASVGRPTRIYLQQLCVDTWYRLEDLPEAMDNRDEWQEGVWEICASSSTRWWWWWLSMYMSSCVCIYRDSQTATSLLANSNSSHDITFTFGLMPLVWTSLFSPFMNE